MLPAAPLSKYPRPGSLQPVTTSSPCCARGAVSSLIAHTSASSRSGEVVSDFGVNGHSAHFQLGQRRIDALHAPLRIHRGDRLGAHSFAARGVHRLERHGGIDLPDHGEHHLAALVHFRDQRVRLMPAIDWLSRALESAFDPQHTFVS